MCLFCQIADGSIPSRKVYEDEHVVAVNDINPQAPVHILIIPKTHKDNVLSFNNDDGKLLVGIFHSIDIITEKMDLQKNGFRVVVNTGVDGGQTVDHIHFHLLGGRPMSWPPG